MKKILILMTICLFLTVPTFANSMAPISIPGKTGIYIDEDSGIELIDELLVITISEDLKTTTYHVNYTFKNTTKETIETPIWFLSDLSWDSHDFTVQVNANEVSHEKFTLKSKSIANWQHNKQPAFIDPYNGQVLDIDSSIYNNEQYDVNAFDLKMDSEAVSEVQIRYEAYNGYVSERLTSYLESIRLTTYALSPAAFYEGKNAIDIQVTVPEKTLLSANIDFNEVVGNTFYITNYNLNKHEDLYLAFVSEPDFKDLFAYTRLGYIQRLVGIQGLILTGFLIVKNKKTRKILLGILAATLLGYLRIMGYASLFYVMAILYYVGIPLVIIGVVVFIIRKRKSTRL